MSSLDEARARYARKPETMVAELVAQPAGAEAASLLLSLMKMADVVATGPHGLSGGEREALRIVAAAQDTSWKERGQR